jgi:hypothetical protein
MPVGPTLPPQARPVRLALPPDLVGDETKNVDIVFVPDDSGSMYAGWGDPYGIRYAAALSVLDLMGRMGGGRAGVVHWGSDAPAELMLALTDLRRGRRSLRKALRAPVVTLGGNNFPAALDRAAEVLDRGGASPEDRIQLVIALTDGIEYLGPEMHTSLARLPAGSVHVLLIDRSGGCNAELEKQWRALPLGFTRLDVLDTEAMAMQIAHALGRAVGFRMPEPAHQPGAKGTPPRPNHASRS